MRPNDIVREVRCERSQDIRQRDIAYVCRECIHFAPAANLPREQAAHPTFHRVPSEEHLAKASEEL